ncbi:hypothetical protein NS365_11865 [Aureimonas ureilytica]|uniref:TsaA-like domain-containing protein n=1 Tax=Aureimonas ureilytica TaxID=401562 RepID=A0A175RR07_9HYPH|nr:tRNA (N6-threonylcarbamoyladenosine(37)-N6)-methyltransferase TrmO [Aureimonas ureilytica]KTR05424.1 hypothetical protein NS365_11865 [Aureimonas ureilytica]
MTLEKTSIRPGETTLPFDASTADDARLAFIGRIRSPWTDRTDCPKNMRVARETNQKARVEIDAPFRAALQNLEAGRHIHLLTWLHQSRRDLAVQKPRSAETASGTFALRSPVRPNPIGLHLVRLLDVDPASGQLVIDAIDVLDGTPLLDIKPYFDTVDRPSED